MQKKESLTLEEKKILAATKLKWQDISFNTQLNKGVAVELVEFYYNLSKIPTPEVIFTGSPLGNQIGANFIGFSEEEIKKHAKRFFQKGKN